MPSFLPRVCTVLPARTPPGCCWLGEASRGCLCSDVSWLKQHVVCVRWVAAQMSSGYLPFSGTELLGPALHLFLSHHFVAERTLDWETMYFG